MRPRKPARVKRRTQRKQRNRSHHRPELIGLALLAAGLFLASLLYLGWDGGRGGGEDRRRPRQRDRRPELPDADRARRLRRAARHALQLLDMRPFRTGSTIVMLGLFLVLGPSAGMIGQGMDQMVGRLHSGAPAVSCSRHRDHRPPAAPHGRVGRRHSAPHAPRRPPGGTAAARPLRARARARHPPRSLSSRRFQSRTSLPSTPRPPSPT